MIVYYLGLAVLLLTIIDLIIIADPVGTVNMDVSFVVANATPLNL
jgi:hypothetical protein